MNNKKFNPMFLAYNGNLKERARKMRNDPTNAEKILWNILRQGELKEHGFLRQKIVGNYIADFYCPKYKLIIEVDGGGHQEPEQQDYDKERTLFFENLEIQVLRFWNNDVLENSEGVYKKILDYFKKKSPQPSLKKEGVKGILKK
jgi:very-short-patch-repair endonuclease